MVKTTTRRKPTAIKGQPVKGRRGNAAAEQNKTTPASGPLTRHRVWQVRTLKGDLIPVLEKAGISVALRKTSNILKRCPEGVSIEVESHQVNEEMPAARASEILEAQGLVPCCSCEFAAWAKDNGLDVDQETTWLAEMPEESGAQRLAIVLSGQTIYTIGFPENLRRGMMLLAVSKQAAHRRAR